MDGDPCGDVSAAVRLAGRPGEVDALKKRLAELESVLSGLRSKPERRQPRRQKRR